jgi:VanZ family protein
MGVVFYGSSISDLPPIPGGLSDKAAHAWEYAGLGFLMARALAAERWPVLRFSTALAAIALSGAYGVSDETHQLFVPNRESDVGDVLADLIGAAAAVGVTMLWGIISRRFGLKIGRS